MELKDTELNNKIKKLKKCLSESEAVVIGAGAGLSTSAGFFYSGERFEKYFFDFINKYHFKDLYTASFYLFKDPHIHWAFWSRCIYVNRYVKIPNDTYSKLYDLVKNKNYFVITTNVDHCFQKSGFNKEKLFYTQGDYGSWQCEKPCRQEVFDNENLVKKMILDQGFEIDCDGELLIKDKSKIKMIVNSNLIPKCPFCGGKIKYHLRSDNSFVENNNWHNASKKYKDFIKDNKNKKILFMDLGIGYNTPSIIKFPFMNYTYSFKEATYCSINMEDIDIPDEIIDKSIIIKSDILKILNLLF